MIEAQAVERVRAQSSPRDRLHAPRGAASEPVLTEGSGAGHAASPPTPAAEVLGVPIHAVDVDDVLGFIGRTLATGGRARVFNANAHLLNLAEGEPRLKAAMNAAELVFCDGFGAKLAARLTHGVRLPRLTPPDWIDALVERCAEDGRSFFFLGGFPGIAQAAAEALHRRHPRARFVGAEHGYFDKRRDAAENRAVIRRINQARPDVLIICFGMPMQELWLDEHWHELDAGIAITAGALFDYVAGTVRRGPRWMTANGLEWLARLVIEPGRLWRRYVLGLPIFFAHVAADAWSRRASRAQ